MDCTPDQVGGGLYKCQEQLIIRQRTGSTTLGDLTHYVHDIYGNVIAETNGGGPTGSTGTVREYIYLHEAEISPTFGSRTIVDRPIGVVEGVHTASPVLWFVHVDHLNRPVKMTDTAKAAVWDAIFLPWGGVHAITGSATLDARFPGQWFQLESGLHYNWHRQYDPSIGRYTQPDPLGFVDGPSVYGYVRGSPQLLIDKDGQWVWVLPVAEYAISAAISTFARNLAIGAALGTAASMSSSTSTTVDKPAELDRTIWIPAQIGGQWNCRARADCNDNIPENCPKDPKRRFAFGGGAANDLGTARNVAKSNATHNLGCQPKHVSCVCTGPTGTPVRGGC